ncbi:hypothetical protein BN159_0062 [Streptomyces davaonensis JCM 4913]|uniref:Uncharacterized protein n=1 Tax=Streptomyces davaonensis (strain DSM 101723 / JCM 4913 / KCC S-0913 / 768) TaxID=1214101 RepID=K4QSD1_STRDJ|nr:hypothetical protein BN159_0062 [Streptomyces davaonensis JCM 4913]
MAGRAAVASGSGLAGRARRAAGGLLPPRDARRGALCRGQRREVGQPARGLPAVSPRACLRPPLAGHGAARRTPRPTARPRPGQGRPLAGPDGRDRGLPVGAGGGEHPASDVGLGRWEEGGRPQTSPGGGLPRSGPDRRSECGKRPGPRRRSPAASAAARAVLLYPTGVGRRRLCRPARRLGPREAPAHPSNRQTHRRHRGVRGAAAQVGGGKDAELADALASPGARLRNTAGHARSHGAVVDDHAHERPPGRTPPGRFQTAGTGER